MICCFSFSMSSRKYCSASRKRSCVICCVFEFSGIFWFLKAMFMCRCFLFGVGVIVIFFTPSCLSLLSVMGNFLISS